MEEGTVRLEAFRGRTGRKRVSPPLFIGDISEGASIPFRSVSFV